jgi:four helix bundle protein
MQDFRQLSTWQKSRSLAVYVYKATAEFPKDELYGLTSQIRRACISIPANIAEGCGRGGNIELSRFLQIALGSASELESHLLLACDLKFLSSQNYERLNSNVNEIKKMIISFIKKLKSDDR